MPVGVHKCPSCGGPLIFDIKEQTLACGYCGSSYTLGEIQDAFPDQDPEATWQQANAEMPSSDPALDPIAGEAFPDGMRAFNCPTCGGRTITDANTAATFCVFCGHPTLLSDKLRGEFTPKRILPFKQTKEQAREAFLSLCRGKPLMPRVFSSPENIEKITGLYVPYWLVDCDCQSNLQCEGRNFTTWSDSSYNYTRTDYYEVLRQGEMHYAAIPADGSSKMDDEMMRSLEPFEYKDLAPFKTQYLTGHLAESYDVASEKVFPIAESRAKESSQDVLRRTVSGYATTVVRGYQASVSGQTAEYVMLPVWTLVTNFGGKKYVFAMNGQTGKMIGKIPISPKRAVGMFFGLFLMIAVIVGAIAAFSI